MSKEYSPEVVAQSFIKQYYEMLGNSPGEMYKFYNDESYFTHCENYQVSENVHGIDKIKERVNQLQLAGASVDLSEGTIDAQLSEQNGVFVVVTGQVTLPSGPPRQFIQSFFLSLQKSSSYFVRNSVFRLLGTCEPSSTAEEMADHIASETVVASVHVPTDEVTVTEIVTAGAGCVVEATTTEHEAKASECEGAVSSRAVAEAVDEAKGGAHGKKESGLGEGADAATGSDMVAIQSSEEQELYVTLVVPPNDTKPSSSSETTTTAPVAASTQKKAPLSFASLAKDWGNIAVGGGSQAGSGNVPASSGANGAAAPTTSTHNLKAGGKNAPKVVANGEISFQPKKNSAQSKGKHGAGSGSGGASASPDTEPNSSGHGKGTGKEGANGSAAASSALPAFEGSAIYINQIPSTTEEKDLRALFDSYGTIRRVDLYPSRGYAFIEFSEVDAVKAILLKVVQDDALAIHGQRIRVEERQTVRSIPGSKQKHGGQGKEKGHNGGNNGKKDASAGANHATAGDASAGNAQHAKKGNQDGAAGSSTKNRAQSNKNANMKPKADGASSANGGNSGTVGGSNAKK